MNILNIIQKKLKNSSFMEKMLIFIIFSILIYFIFKRYKLSKTLMEGVKNDNKSVCSEKWKENFSKM